MDVPILERGSVLVATVQTALSDADLRVLREALVSRVSDSGARGVVVDLTALDVVDSFATRTLRDMAQGLRVEGADTVVVGIQPDVAYAMAQLGLALDGLTLAADVDAGIALLGRRKRQRRT